MKDKFLLFIICFIVLGSCASKRNLVYFSNSSIQGGDTSYPDKSIKIQHSDILRVNINSLNPESNSLFTVSRESILGSNREDLSGYKVGKEGTIVLPVIGSFRVEGLTIAEAQDALTEELAKYVKQPIVEVQLVNFKITVIGEVNRPSSFTIPGDKINLLEALGMAGDMTVYGKRENVLIIREQNGRRVMKRLDMNNENILNDPFFNLMQNDVVYVEPDRSKAIEYSPNTRILPVVIASISAVAVLISAVLRRY